MTKIPLLVPVLLLIFSLSCSSTKKKSADEPVFLEAQVFIPDLSKTLHEISGLIIYDDLFWGLNDSGGKDKIYGFNKKGNIKKEIELKDAKNNDWEALAQDEKNIYIGDFGNNSGRREKLHIYKFKKKDVKNKKEQKVDTKKISFTYTKQKQLKEAQAFTEFDCEALVEFGGNLYLFSKNRNDFTTSVYKIPSQKGEYELKALDAFNVDGLITGADISPDKKQLALLGYKNYKSFLWLFTDFNNDNFFQGSSQRYELRNSNNLQSEGICYYSNDTLLVSCERTSHFKQQVFLFDLSEVNDGTHTSKQ
jgi:hypothetical protein